MDRTISATEAEERFDDLLRDVAEGVSFTIISQGNPIARIVPVENGHGRAAVKRLLDFVDGLPIRHAGDWTRTELHR